MGGISPRKKAAAIPEINEGRGTKKTVRKKGLIRNFRLEPENNSAQGLDNFLPLFLNSLNRNNKKNGI